MLNTFDNILSVNPVSSAFNGDFQVSSDYYTWYINNALDTQVFFSLTAITAPAKRKRHSRNNVLQGMAKFMGNC